MFSWSVCLGETICTLLKQSPLFAPLAHDLQVNSFPKPKVKV